MKRFALTFLAGMDLRRVNGATVHSLNLVKALHFAGVETQVVSFDSLNSSHAAWMFKAPFAAKNRVVFIRSGAPLVPVLIARLLGKRAALNVAALKHLECNGLTRPFVKIAEDIAIRLADGGIATISPRLANYARAHGAKRVFVYPVCVDYEKFSRTKAAKAKTRGEIGKFVLGYVGSGDEWQGLGMLAEALKKVGGKKIELRAYGAFSDAAKSDFAGDSRVKFFKPVDNDEIPALLKSFDLFVIPRPHHATAEYATPIKLVEAFAAGCAVLATAVGGVTWLARDGENALVCESSPDALAEKIVFALNNPGVLARIRRKASKTARESDYRIVGPRLARFIEGSLN